MKKQLISALTVFVLLFTQGLVMPAAQAAMVTTGAMVAQEQRADLEQKVMRLVNQEAASKVLASNGVTPDDVQQRLARLSDSELQQLANKADALPAGEGVLGVILLVILILVLLDLLGVTNVFPAIN